MLFLSHSLNTLRHGLDGLLHQGLRPRRQIGGSEFEHQFPEVVGPSPPHRPKVIKRYHDPSTPYERALAHQEVPKAVKRRLREQYRTLDLSLPAEIRAA
jgi:hypothetical protein